ncbi:MULTISPECIES: hypothetical protein [unclassified Mycolicibacterium]|uniref:hypothetical protein n=1 Tax=unclassified Mycolicibacterium TaxID=2636767 RepID=UPI0012DD91A6|nr:MULTISPECIES: hypothetical protein [unclassified Mycolicibacterium]MUL83581.1 hypothetical protein [Mycolicibacterium sp. CBMA 329]MUL90572.1 hypothetical protein [Mycolicibacterium sp. CBMA 331]MUM00542.1 hypothetical protein [Mycolicibacterium sp. CBMA 334]MUM25434.1 hypothetical protein [Mycolicibacterium sp. CBMA 295]MUM41516.1 hypothetical protein [Mycolicibacterium sp. CBMA 247]
MRRSPKSRRQPDAGGRGQYRVGCADRRGDRPDRANVIIFINVQGERSGKQVRADVAGQITEVV